MPDRPRPRFNISAEGRLEPEIASILEEGWETGLETGLVRYDPRESECVVAPPFRYHYLPQRAGRPGARKTPRPPPEGLRIAHAPCPFDGESFVAERELARFTREGQVYHLTANRYPVTPRHFLLVRSSSAPEAQLSQYIQAPEEVEDMLRIQAMVGPPYRAYFNSNRGADNSQSGSSLNHWHFQIFWYPGEYDSPLLRIPAALRKEECGLTVEEVAEWPARHILVEADHERIAQVAQVLWKRVRRLNDLNVAYNVEVVPLGGSRFRAFLFARHPGPDRVLPGAGSLSADFGGWELSGDIVIPTVEVLQWIRDHPGEATRLTAERLEETTRPCI